MALDKKILLQAAKELRKNSTDVENLLWKFLRSNRLKGIKFRRQHIIGRFIIDFICLERKIIVELDGGHHASQKERDNERDSWLESEGYRVLRFWNNELLENTEAILNRILEACFDPPSPPAPLPSRERGLERNQKRGHLHPSPFGRRGLRIFTSPLRGEGAGVRVI